MGKGKVLRVRIGSGMGDDSLKVCSVNEDSQPVPVNNEYFTGYATVRILKFEGITPDQKPPVGTSLYFKGRKRAFSLQVEGQFHESINGDDIVMAADFDKPLSLPLGVSIMVEFAKLIDPGLEINLNSSQPIIQSPLLCAMNTMASWRLDNLMSPSPPLKSDGTNGVLPAAPSGQKSDSVHTSPKELIAEWPWRWGGEKEMKESLFVAKSDPETVTTVQKLLRRRSSAPMFSDGPVTFTNASQRRKHFLHKPNRTEFQFDPDRVYGFDWFSPYINWNAFELQLGLNIKASRYLNGQPARFVVRNRDKSKIFFVIEFHLVDNVSR